jgi:hypothetical protein
MKAVDLEPVKGDREIPVAFWMSAGNIAENVRGVLKDVSTDLQACDQNRFKDKPASIKVQARQPYSTLVLADLIYARGAPDEAVEVLAQWLSYSQKNSQNGNGVPKWWQLRVESRIALWMAEIAGQNNFAYRRFFNSYKKDLENYFGSSNRPQRVSLDQMQAKCRIWRPYLKQGADLPKDVLTEQKSLFLLLAAEDESLRTELNFIGEEGGFDRLEDLQRRAALVANIGHECLPQGGEWKSALREATIADHLITAGLVGLTVADRMQTLARSRGDRDRAMDIARDAEKHLRSGYARLSQRVRDDRDEIQGKPEWSDRIFGESTWEKSANLAARALIRLRTED